MSRKFTTISVTEEVSNNIGLLAKRFGKSKNEILKEALVEYVKENIDDSYTGRDLLNDLRKLTGNVEPNTKLKNKIVMPSKDELRQLYADSFFEDREIKE